MDPESARLFELVKKLIGSASYDDALLHLDKIEVTPATETEIAFLRAVVFEAKGDLEGAVALYRGILAEQPQLARVRLELARVLFRLKDDDAAKHHFELVLGSDPPEAVRRNIERYLADIHRRRRVRYSFGFSLVPDTNINAATSAQQTDLFGIPFDLSDDARKTSGVGVSLNAGVDLYHPIIEGLNIEAGAAGRMINYKGGAFDDDTIYGYAGIRHYFDVNDIGIRATASRRWYGNDGYSYGLGGRLDVGRRFGPQWAGRLYFSGQRYKYDVSDYRDGAIYVAQAELSHVFGGDSRAYVAAGVSYEDTRDPAYTNIGPFVGLGYEKDLPYRLRLGVFPQLALVYFDSPLAAFGKTREDTYWRVKTQLTYRDDLIFGFAPVLSYTYTRNLSNIELYDYDRHRFEVGLTRSF